MPNIHPAAIISDKAKIADDVQIGPFSIVGDDVTIHKGCEIGSSVNIQGCTEIGAGCRIFTGAVIGSITQDLKYKGEKTFIRIGEDNTVREYVTINSGTSGGESTVIGNRNLLMAYVHIAHNCIIGNNVIIANAGTLAGHVIVEDFAIIGGLAGIHQFCRIGKHSIIGGCSKVTKDIIPFVMADGHPAIPFGVNKTGLKRRNFSSEQILQIETAYRYLFRSGLNVSEALSKIEGMGKNDEVLSLVEFIREAQRGIAK
ncbi:MAG TPA: acyl-ACP--UDP-N-acetylglucosamine O-acyltransferase [bacterium]|nr:acyl-ACP--UDP-N-acetylglucosamine O-acyltransferase [bacterium]